MLSLLAKKDQLQESLIFRRFFLIASLVIGLCISAIFLGLAMRSKSLIIDQAIAQARSHFQGILLSRQWNAQHGGVYVIKGSGMKSNPYLENPDIITADGRTLTLKNPALMTREVSELANDNNLFSFRITSLRPLNPNNAPSHFETVALRAFETGAKEHILMEDKTEGAFLRYMAPLYTEAVCLSCHGKQGYKVGDVRGGISVSLGIDPINKALRQNNLTIATLSVATVSLLLVTLWFFFRQMQSRLDESQEALRKMATTDMLTKIANRASLISRFNDSFARRRRNVTTVGCLMVDVDHFKSVNDRFGHLKGDAVLKELADIIVPTVRQYDTFGRYGGEEFLIVLEGIDLQMLHAIAERIRAIVEENLGKRAGLSESITISIGGTLVEKSDSCIEDAIRRADEALYLAKGQGRNRSVISIKAQP